MENKGLLFIPDISGFTRFVTETELQHSQLIIQELLEVLINANQIGLEVSEIEGDAILFYKFGDPPNLEELYKQVEKMFCVFHQNLIFYDQRRYCQCKACISAASLTLKVITHYGEFTSYNVKNFSKLIGKDVIVAHQLLKNDIDQHEYWLVTKDLRQVNPTADFAEWMKWDTSIKHTETGEIYFSYALLSPLKSELSPALSPQVNLSGKRKLLSLTREYETDIVTLFHATGDFNYRHQWWDGVKKVEEINHFLPRVGMHCRCIMENGDSIIYYSNSYSFQPERIEFSETDEKRAQIIYFTLETTGNNNTKLTIDFYLSNNFLTQTIYWLLKKNKTERTINKSLQNLVPLLKEIRI